jgi:hypothetical protein
MSNNKSPAANMQLTDILWHKALYNQLAAGRCRTFRNKKNLKDD